MFIRVTSQRDKKTNREYTNYRLVESYRNQSGKVRQQTLLNLGVHFAFPKDEWKPLANRVEEILSSQQSMFGLTGLLEKEAQRIAKLITKKYSEITSCKQNESTYNTKTDIQTVDINSLEHRDVRKVGGEHVGYHAVKQLNLNAILEDVGFNNKQINTAIGSIIGRLVQPGSELRARE